MSCKPCWLIQIIQSPLAQCNGLGNLWRTYRYNRVCLRKISSDRQRTFSTENYGQNFVSAKFRVPAKWEWLLNFRQHSQKIEDFYVSLTKHSLERRDFHQREWNLNNDFMQYLMKIRNRGYLFDDETDASIRVDIRANKHLSLTEVSSQAFLAFTSGFPTILSTLIFFMFEIASNSAIQDKLSAEIEGLYKRTDGSPEYSDIARMKYLESCLNETLRKYPPIPYLVLYCTKMPIFVSILVIHHDPKYYPNPMEFIPSRFSSTAVRRRQQSTLLPFGLGPKHRIGFELAKAILKIHLVFILWKYFVSVGPKMTDREINFDNGYLTESKRR